jgi:hypothetical protein
MSVDISVNITEDIVDIIATPTVNIVNVTNSASIDPSLYDLSEFTNTSVNPFVRTSGLSSYVPTTRTLTINGTTQDLSANRTFTVSTGITIGTTAITSGTVGRVLFEGTGNVVQESANLFWDNTNGRLGIGTSSPSAIIHSVGSVTASGAIARSNYLNNTLVASANSDVLVGLDIQPTFTNGAFTGVENIPLRFVTQLNSAITKGILLKNIGTGAGVGTSIGFNTTSANNLSNAFIKSFYATTGLSMSFGTGGGAGLTTEGTTALILNPDQTAIFSAKVTATTGGFQATGVSANLLMSDGGTPVITRNGSTGIQFLKDVYWQTFSIFTNNTENLRVASTGNVLINTTTDAGFKLDVNGTARVKDAGSELAITSPLSAIAPVIFTTKGASGGYRGGYNFKGGFGGNAGNTIFIIDTTNTDAGSRGGFGNFLFSDLAAAKFTIDNTQSGGRNAALRLRGNFANNFTEYNGIDFNAYTGTDIGGFIGSQRNSASSGFGADIVVLATLDSAPSTYLEVARFIGRYNSFYVGTDKTLAVASAKMQVESTTQGFLPPRMTTTQINAIASPAEGLTVYNTTISHMCFYQAGSWVKINHSPM